MYVTTVSAATRSALVDSAGLGPDGGSALDVARPDGARAFQQQLRNQLAGVGWMTNWMQHNDVPRFLRSDERMAGPIANLDAAGTLLRGAAQTLGVLGGSPQSVTDLQTAATYVRQTAITRSAVTDAGDAVRQLTQGVWARELGSVGGVLYAPGAEDDAELIANR
jgi:hypothetical protein